MTDRRAAPRESYLCRAEVTWRNGNRDETAEAKILDRSSFGLGVIVEKPIRPGTYVQVKDRSRTIIGTVRHWVRNPDGSALIGVVFEREPSDSREPVWRQAEYQAQPLL